MLIELLIMYAAQTNSPATELYGACDASDTTIYVKDGTVLPDAVPFLLTIGFDTSASETVLVTEKNGDQLTVTRGVDGAALSWVADTKCARMFTAKDLNDVQANLATLGDGVDDARIAVGMLIAELCHKEADWGRRISDLEIGETSQGDRITALETDNTANKANLTPYVSSDMTAPAALAAGDYVLAAGTLYRVIADIANGATLTPDTNVTATTVAAELAALTNSKVDKSDWIVNEPGLFLLSKILCPDYSVTTNGRKLSKKFNHMKHEYVSSSSVARTLFFTGTEYSSQSNSPSQVSTIALKNLVPVTMLDVKNGQLYFEAYAISDYTGSANTSFHIMYCSVDENDAVTILSKVSLMTPVAKNVFAISPSPIEVPSGATHFALGQYSAGAGPAFEAVINFKIVPTE